MIIRMLFSGDCGFSSISIIGNSTKELADHGEYPWNVSLYNIIKFMHSHTKGLCSILVIFKYILNYFY